MQYVDSLNRDKSLGAAIKAFEGFYALAKLLAQGGKTIKVPVKMDYSDKWKYREKRDFDFTNEDLKTMTPND